MEKTERAIYKLLKRFSNKGLDGIDDSVELHLLCMDLFNTTGTLIQCFAKEKDYVILPLGRYTHKSERPLREKKKIGSLDVTKLIESPLFEKVVIKDGLELLIGETSIWCIDYNPWRNQPVWDILGISVNPETDIELVRDLLDFNPERIVGNRIYILSKRRDRIVADPIDVEFPETIDVERNYNDDLPYEEILSTLLNKEQSGLILFHGEKGTGKTTFIRHLIWKNKMEDFKTIIVTSSFVDTIGTPEFLNYCLEQEPGTLFVLEDCEKVLQSRELIGNNRNISDILNMSDGLLGDIAKGIKFICTFNTSINNIDGALTRSGRLLVNYKFQKLSLEKTRTLIPGATREMSLNEIYCPKIIGEEVKTERANIGFLNR